MEVDPSSPDDQREQPGPKPATAAPPAAARSYVRYHVLGSVADFGTPGGRLVHPGTPLARP